MEVGQGTRSGDGVRFPQVLRVKLPCHQPLRNTELGMIFRASRLEGVTDNTVAPSKGKCGLV